MTEAEDIIRAALPKRKRWLLYVLVVLGGVAMAMPFWGGLIGVPFPIRFLGPLLGIGIARVAYRVINRSFRKHVKSLDRLEADERPPVLFLRSFAEELVSQPQKIKGIRSPLAIDQRLEEAVTLLLGFLGPVVAIGSPSELPQLGAQRLPATNQDWQQRVGTLMEEAGVVVLTSGTTRGLLWEVEEAARRVDPRKLILFLAREQACEGLIEREVCYRGFRELAKDLLPRGLPAMIGDAVFIRFGDDWEPILVEPPEDAQLGEDVQASLIVALNEMSEEFSRLNLRFERQRRTAGFLNLFASGVVRTMFATLWVLVIVIAYAASSKLVPEHLWLATSIGSLLYPVFLLGAAWFASGRVRILQWDREPALEARR